MEKFFGRDFVLRKKKVLVHGTAESLQKFFADAVSRDFEIIGVLGDDKISVQGLEVFTPQNLPNVLLKLVDGIIFTDVDTHKSMIDFFVRAGFAPRKIILWDAARAWASLNIPDRDGTPTIFFCGLEFHLRNDADKNFFAQMLWQLNNQRRVKNLPPQMYSAASEQSYRQIMGKPLDLNNTRTFAEKLYWLKIFDATPIKSRLADKYLVRSWVAEKIGDEYLIPLLGVWDDFDDINFDDLPDQFVLKCNHGSAMNIICRDKKTFDMQNAREKLNAWLAFDFATWFLELHYSRIDRKIIAEKFLSDGTASDINDYKFWCFDGRVEYVQVDRNRSTDHVQKFYSVDWEPLDMIISGHKLDTAVSEKPPMLEKMLKIAETLSVGFGIVRVDLYCLGDKIYFGEMTFTPLAGYIQWKPQEVDHLIGNLVKLKPDN